MSELKGPWWDQSKCDLHYFVVRTLGMDIYIGGRPCHRGTTVDFARKMCTWVNVSDRLHTEYVIPPWRPQMPWYPLIEGDAKPEDWGWKIVYWFSRILDRELRSGSKSIYVHCDGGTHRSPTLVYMWLVDLVGRTVARKVFEGRTIVPDDAYNRMNFDDPDGYLDSHIRDGTIPPDDERKLFLKIMRDNSFSGVDDVLREVGYIKERRDVEEDSSEEGGRNRGSRVSGRKNKGDAS